MEELEKNNRLSIVDLNHKYETSGLQGPIQVWKEEAVKTRELGYEFLWGSGAPQLESCGNFSNLIRFEHLLEDTLSDLNVIGICPYLYNDASKNSFNEFVELMKYHHQVILHTDNSLVYLENNLAAQ